jgi:hypothetical protein
MNSDLQHFGYFLFLRIYAYQRLLAANIALFFYESVKVALCMLRTRCQSIIAVPRSGDERVLGPGPGV